MDVNQGEGLIVTEGAGIEAVLVNLIEEDSGPKRDRARDTELEDKEELGKLDMLTKRAKLEEVELDVAQVGPIFRNKTMQDDGKP